MNKNKAKKKKKIFLKGGIQEWMSDRLIWMLHNIEVFPHQASGKIHFAYRCNDCVCSVDNPVKHANSEHGFEGDRGNYN